MTWSTILGVVLIVLGVAVGLVIVGGVIVAILRAVRKPAICEKCGHREGDPITGPPIMRTRPPRGPHDDPRDLS